MEEKDLPSLRTESFQGNKLDKKVWQENDIPLKLI